MIHWNRAFGVVSLLVCVLFFPWDIFQRDTYPKLTAIFSKQLIINHLDDPKAISYSDSREYTDPLHVNKDNNGNGDRNSSGTIHKLTLKDAYHKALQARADKTKTILLASTDYGFTDMAVNLYYSSFRRFNITNYLYVSYDLRASKILSQHGIAHFTLFSSGNTTLSSNWGTKSFVRKTHIKTEIVLGALRFGFTVLILDVDIVFLKHPFPFTQCDDCDILISSDESEGNSGFYLARPTTRTIELHKIAYQKSLSNPRESNQKALDRTMEMMEKQGRIKTKMLSVQEFSNGRSYFESGHRMFAGDNPCKTCVIVHNNWIVSPEAKIYRFKEHLMWHYDKDSYYSDPTTNYLTYDNPFDFGADTVTMEIEALRAALILGDLLNRKVILPKFHCHKCVYGACKTTKGVLYPNAHCSLNTHVRLSTFDKYFPDAYRENVFLKHPLVPTQTVQYQSPTILIRTKTILDRLTNNTAEMFPVQMSPNSSVSGPTTQEIDDFLRPLVNYKVLRFHSLYKVISDINSSYHYPEFIEALQKGFVKTDYRQY